MKYHLKIPQLVIIVYPQINYCLLLPISRTQGDVVNQPAEHKEMLSWGKSIISMNSVFLHCHTISYQWPAIIVDFSNMLLMIVASKNFAIFHQDSPYSCTFQLEASNLKELDAILVPPQADEFWAELCYSLAAFYKNILKKSSSRDVLLLTGMFKLLHWLAAAASESWRHPMVSTVSGWPAYHTALAL